jgi:hypothetical protein
MLVTVIHCEEPFVLKWYNNMTLRSTQHALCHQRETFFRCPDSNKYAVIQNYRIVCPAQVLTVAVVIVGLPLRSLAARPLTVIDVGSWSIAYFILKWEIMGVAFQGFVLVPVHKGCLLLVYKPLVLHKGIHRSGTYTAAYTNEINCLWWHHPRCVIQYWYSNCWRNQLDFFNNLKIQLCYDGHLYT